MTRLNRSAPPLPIGKFKTLSLSPSHEVKINKSGSPHCWFHVCFCWCQLLCFDLMSYPLVIELLIFSSQPKKKQSEKTSINKREFLGQSGGTCKHVTFLCVCWSRLSPSGVVASPLLCQIHWVHSMCITHCTSIHCNRFSSLSSVLLLLLPFYSNFGGFFCSFSGRAEPASNQTLCAFL